MALLWRGRDAGAAPARPGPRQGLTVDEIVDAAVELADEEGMASVSMRTVGKRLNRTGMALYTYIPSKSELVDLMYDRVLAQLPTEYDLTVGWRAAAKTWAEDYWTFCLRHPWVLQVSQARPVLGPNEYVTIETLLRVLTVAELPPDTLRGFVWTLMNFVRGSAQAIAETRQAPKVTGVSDDEWWYARSAMLEEVAPDFGDQFPLLVQLESSRTAQPPDDCRPEDGQPEDGGLPYMEHQATVTFRSGLQLLLDGAEANR